VSTVSASAAHFSALAYLCTYFTWHLLYLYAPHTLTATAPPLLLLLLLLGPVFPFTPDPFAFACVSSSVCQLSLHLFKCASWFSISRNKWPKSAAAQVPILHIYTQRKYQGNWPSIRQLFGFKGRYELLMWDMRCLTKIFLGTLCSIFRYLSYMF